MIKWMSWLSKWFTYYDEAKDSGKGVSVSMVMVAIAILSGLAVQFGYVDIGLTDAQIAELSKYLYSIFVIIVGWVRFDATKPLSVRNKDIPKNTNKGNTGQSSSILDDD